jgi:hypothetical protein
MPNENPSPIEAFLNLAGKSRDDFADHLKVFAPGAVLLFLAEYEFQTKRLAESSLQTGNEEPPAETTDESDLSDDDEYDRGEP